MSFRSVCRGVAVVVPWALVAWPRLAAAQADASTPPTPPTPAGDAKPADTKADTKAAGDAKPKKPKGDEPPEPPKKPITIAPASPKRPLPDYDGRGPKPHTAGEDLLWVPRLIFSPIYLTTEYVIRRPLGAAVAAAERSNLPQVLYDFFVFGPDHKIGVVPTLYFDFGLSPSVGLLGFWNDAGFKGNNLSAHFSIWTDEWIAGSVADSIRFHKDDTFTVKLAAIRRPDRTYFGQGPSTLESHRSRYLESRLEASEGFNFPLWRSSQIMLGSGVRSVSLSGSDYDDDPSVGLEAARGVYALPDAYGQTYSEEFNNGLIALDTRKPKGSKTGVRLEAQAEQGSNVRSSPDSGWIRYQGTAGVFYDLNGRGRVLSLTGTALFADPLVKGGNIPFTELVALGGNTPILSALATGTGLMPGYYPGRLVDRSAAVATLQYRWPIWAFLDGTLQVATGNVFGTHLDEFKLSLLRFSGAIGIESNAVSDSALHLLVGIGSETFDHGGQIDSVRLAFGTSRF